MTNLSDQRQANAQLSLGLNSKPYDDSYYTEDAAHNVADDLNARFSGLRFIVSCLDRKDEKQVRFVIGVWLASGGLVTTFANDTELDKLLTFAVFAAETLDKEAAFKAETDRMVYDMGVARSGEI